MRLEVISGGLLTTVQDLGRWGFQGIGMPVAGAMDSFALQVGNIIVGNDPNAAALEITVMGPTLQVSEGEGVICLAGASLDMRINKEKAPTWTAIRVKAGDKISIGGPTGPGCRAYLCVSGGIDVPVVMGSRSTYLRAHIGGLEGRAIQKQDTLLTGPLPTLWQLCEGFSCPSWIIPPYGQNMPINVILGPQDDYFTSEGIETFLSSEYTITNEADRMGYRLDGPEIEHKSGADIISDAIPLGAIQVPGSKKPVAMLADRQTTGGYTKIAVITTPHIALLAQRLPGEKVSFKKVSFEEAAAALKEGKDKLRALEIERANYRSTRKVYRAAAPKSGPTHWSININGKNYQVTCEEIS